MNTIAPKGIHCTLLPAHALYMYWRDRRGIERRKGRSNRRGRERGKVWLQAWGIRSTPGILGSDVLS